MLCRKKLKSAVTRTNTVTKLEREFYCQVRAWSPIPEYQPRGIIYERIYIPDSTEELKLSAKCISANLHADLSPCALPDSTCWKVVGRVQRLLKMFPYPDVAPKSGSMQMFSPTQCKSARGFSHINHQGDFCINDIWWLVCKGTAFI